ncbi:MAG TPA: HDOD domain-containing protein [Candidatus Hydrogenedentes bacterium]|nr:HDOD domain-containing protein [Candidatus Hydrogenedentota bacterium]
MSTLKRGTLRQRIEALEFLPVLPAVVKHVVSRSVAGLQDEKVLARLVGLDPSLTAQVLRVAGTQLGAASTQLGAANAQLRAAGTQLGAANAQLRAAGTQLGAAGTQLGAAGTQLGAAGTQFGAANAQLWGGNAPFSSADAARRGGRTAVTRVEDAVSWIGLQQVRRIILGAALSPDIARSGTRGLDFAGYWRHALACATCAESIAARIGSAHAGAAYAAGLLHDVGKLVLDTIAPDDYADALDFMRMQNVFVLEAERRTIGIDHALAGKWLAERWGLPEPLIGVIWLHHHPEESFESVACPAELMRIVRLADALSQGLPADLTAKAAVPPVSEELVARLGLKPLAIRNLHDELIKEIRLRVEELGLDEALEAGLGEGAPAADRFAAPRAHAELAAINALADAETESLQRKVNRFRALHEMNLKLRPGQSFKDVLRIIADAVRQGLEVSQGLCLVADPEENQLRGKMWRSMREPASDFALSLDDGEADDRANLGARIVSVLEEVALGRAEGGWAGAALSDVVRRNDLVVVPMLGAGRSVGQIIFDVEASTIELSEEGLSEVLAFAGACGLALARYQAEALLVERTEELATAIWKKEMAHQQLIRAERLASVGKMAAGAAHEINNPLAVISGRAQILLSRTEDPEMAKALDVIVRQSQRASKILTDLMQFARPALPKLEPTLVNVAVHEVVAMVWDRLDAKGIRVVEHFAEGLPRALLDKRQIEQVLLNLILNAEHAMRESGGVLTFRTGAADGRRLVTIQVADTGHGIAPNVLPHIFEPFFTTKDEGEGTGLGLSVCHGIIEGHHGSIAVQSEVGEGATFTVSMPSATDLSRQLERAAGAAASERDAGRPVILVVDDDADLLEVLKETLLHRGYGVETAADGVEAIEVMSRAAVDLVLLDIRMPTLDGLAVLEQLRERFTRIPAIVITGLASQEEVAEALRLGARSCLRKPFEIERLLAEVRLVLSEK